MRLRIFQKPLDAPGEVYKNASCSLSRELEAFFLKSIYLIKDLSRISGHTTHTLKYYMRLGLLQEFGRSPSTNFRYFDDNSIERLKEIRSLQVKGHSLKEIKSLLAVSA